MDSTVMDNAGLTPNAQKKVNKITLRNLTPAQKKAITASGIGLAGVMAEAGVLAMFGFASGENAAMPQPPLETPETPEASETCEIYTIAPLATNVNDGMGFKQAFETAREEVDGGGGFFEWHGQVYSTYTENEWNAMSADDREAFSNSLHNNPDFEVPETPETAVQVDHTDPVVADEQTSPQFTVPEVAPDAPPAAEQERSSDEPYEIDLNGDGAVDSLALDFDGDGYLDIVAIDTDAGTLPDTYLTNADDEIGLETVVLDPEQDGLDGAEQVEILAEDQIIILSVEESQEPVDTSPNEEVDFTTQEDLPDLDDNADVSDFT